MIEKEEIMERLLIAVPSYKDRYERYIQENYEPGEERLIYVDISDFVKHVIKCYQRKTRMNSMHYSRSLKSFIRMEIHLLKNLLQSVFWNHFRINYLMRIWSILNLKNV